MTNATKKVHGYVKSILKDDIAHGIEHVERVRNWAIKIARSEKYPDIEIVEIIALLHDIGFSKTKDWTKHAKLGAKMATHFLNKGKLISPDKIQKIEQVIKEHSNSLKKQDILINILRDADMLDMIGAVGIMRTFISQHTRLAYDKNNLKGLLWKSSYKNAYKNYSSKYGAGKTIIDQLNFQMHCMKEMSTSFGKRTAKKLCKYMTDFILELEKEIVFQEK